MYRIRCIGYVFWRNIMVWHMYRFRISYIGHMSRFCISYIGHVSRFCISYIGHMYDILYHISDTCTNLVYHISDIMSKFSISYITILCWYAKISNHYISKHVSDTKMVINYNKIDIINRCGLYNVLQLLMTFVPNSIYM